MGEQRLDCRNLRCPMPIVQLALAVRGMQVGETVRVEATDPAFLADARAWSRMSGHALDAVEDGETKTIVVRKVKP